MRRTSVPPSSRLECWKRLPALHKLDPLQFPVPEPTKLLFWRWGHDDSWLIVQQTGPVEWLGLVAGPGLDSRLPLDPNNWTNALFRNIIASEGRPERALVGEFLRLHPDRALSVHIFSITRPNEILKLFKYNRTLPVIFYLRNAMRFLNIDYEVPVPDPYVTEGTILKKNQKSTLHLTRMFDRMEHERNLMNMRLAITSRSIETVKSLADQSSLSVKEVTHRAVMTAQLELGMISGRKRKIITEGKTKGKAATSPKVLLPSS